MPKGKEPDTIQPKPSSPRSTSKEQKVIIYTNRFNRHYARRIRPHKALVADTLDAIETFMTDRTAPILYDHALGKGEDAHGAFSVTGDIRIRYKETDHEFVFLDIGTHAQVYGL